MDVDDPEAFRCWILLDYRRSILLNPGLAQGEDVNVVIGYDVVNQRRFADSGSDIEAGEVDGGRRRHLRVADRTRILRDVARQQ